MPRPLEVLSQAGDAGLQMSPQAKALGLQLISMSPAEAIIKLPYRAELVGEPDNGILAGGAVTTLLDHVCGQAVWASLEAYTSIATLDLRIDYAKPAEPGKPVIAEAECYRMTRSVAFTRAFAHQGDPKNPIAAAAGTFMLGTKGKVTRPVMAKEFLK